MIDFEKKIKNKVAKNYFDMLVQYQQDFSMVVSSAGTEFICNGSKKFIENGKNSKKIFGVLKKLKKELELKLEWFNAQTKDKACNYYSINFNVLGGAQYLELSSDMFAIDIQSAYLNVLYNYKHITKELYNSINTLEKKDRLKILGLLAHRKGYFKFENGLYVGYERQEKNEFEACFYYCVQKTAEIMKLCAKKLGSDFFCHWVDCVYFKGVGNINLVSDILKSHGFKFTTKKIIYMNIRKNKNYILFNYLIISEKNLKKENKKQTWGQNYKDLHIPLTNMELNLLKLNLQNAIISSDYNQIEDCQTKINKYNEKNN